MLFCDGMRNEPRKFMQSQCPEKHICRTHRKLGLVLGQQQQDGFDDVLHGEEPPKLLMDGLHFSRQFPQCVREDELDMDAFCEDKILEDFQNGGRSSVEDVDGSVLKRIISERSEMVTELKYLVKQCSPFVANRKQVMQCALAERKCARKDLSGNCVSDYDIHPLVEQCPNWDVCRKYKEDGVDTPQCIPSKDAICRDRFWSMYSDELVAEAKARRSENMTRSLNFRFCDPYKFNKQMECDLDISITRRQRQQVRSLQSPAQLELVRMRLRKEFPDLHSMLFHEHMDIEYAVTTKVNRVKHLFCPSEVTRLRQQQPGADEKMVLNGPVCRQLSRKVSRCMPRAELEIPVSTREQIRARLAANRTLAEMRDPLLLGYDGAFCLSVESPGQYCVPGTPEVGIICPQGHLVACKRPHHHEPDDWNDLGAMERCTQKFGEYPAVDVNSTDAFRHAKVVDMFGDPVDFGYYAECKSHP